MLDLAYLGNLILILVIVLSSIPISAVYAIVSRRATAWTPVILMAALAVASRGNPADFVLAVLILCAWFIFSWPRNGQSEFTARGKKRWHPLVALVASVGTFVAVALALALLRWLIDLPGL